MRSENYQTRQFKGASIHGSRPRRARLPSSLPTAYCPLPALRRGISLLEVLISMFVLLFGLMGVAAVFPVGNHYATQGEKYDRDVALVDAAFAELKARGILKPERWLYASETAGVPTGTVVPVIEQNNNNGRKGQFMIDSTVNTDHPGYVYVIDPLGAAAAAEVNARPDSTKIADAWAFPWYDMSNFGDANVSNAFMPAAWVGAANRPGLNGQNWPIRRVGLDIDPRPGVNLPSASTNPPDPGNPRGMPAPLADAVFRLRDDLSVELPKESDRPGIQRWQAYDSGTPTDPFDDVPLARGNVGNYSWLATVVPSTADDSQDSVDALTALQPADVAYGQKFYDVSVAVFYKRDFTPSATSERTIAGELLAGGQLTIFDAENDNLDAIDAAVDGLRPGQWIAVAGVLPSTRRNGNFTPSQLLLKWYRVLAIDDETTDLPIHTGASPMAARPGRRLMLEGPDWPAVNSLKSSDGTVYIPNLRVIVLPGIIGVTTRSVRMEVDSPWTVQNYPGPSY